MKLATTALSSLLILLVLNGLGCGVQESPQDPVVAAAPSGPPVAAPPAVTPTAGTTGAAGSTPNASGGAGTMAMAGSMALPPALAGMGGGAAGSDPGTVPPPDPTEGIDINGTFVPRDHAIVFIHFGHSNMAGRAVIPASLMSYFYTPRANLWSYQDGQFVPAKEPTAPDNTIGQGAGPGMAWLIAASEKAGPDYHFISIARAQTSAPSSDFVKGGLYYSSIIDPALQLKGKVTFGAIFTMLGITDRHLPTSQQGGFADRMVSIASDMRADLGEPNLPMLNCDYEMEATGSLAPTGSVGTKFVPLIQMLPTLIPNSVLIPTDGLDMQDDHHFTMTGHKDWADRGVQLMVDKGWFPWMP